MLKLTAALVATAIFAAAPAAAQNVTIDNQVFTEVAKDLGNGSKITVQKTADKMVPGTTVVYVMTVRNKGAQPAKNLVINNPVPAGVVYLGAGEGAEPIVSVDHGKTFGKLANLTVGSGSASRPARTSDVTNVRWTIGSTEPGASAKVSYRGQLK